MQYPEHLNNQIMQNAKVSTPRQLELEERALKVIDGLMEIPTTSNGRMVRVDHLYALRRLADKGILRNVSTDSTTRYERIK